MSDRELYFHVDSRFKRMGYKADPHPPEGYLIHVQAYENEYYFLVRLRFLNGIGGKSDYDKITKITKQQYEAF